MPEFGQFQILEPLKLTDHGSVNVATRIGEGERRYALKVYPVPAEAVHGAPSTGDDEEEISPHWEAQYFLDHARVQQKLIAGGAAHWAAVYDLGMTPAGAYVVLDYCPRSVQTLLDEKAQLTPAELHALAAGVLAGLQELKRLRGRSHGDLKPANVLLDGSAGVAAARILLTDPGPPAAAARTGEDGDLRELGEMLRALVVADAIGESANRAWDRLGAKSNAWREYVGGLLGASRGTPLGTLAAAQSALPRAAQARPMPKVARKAVAAGVSAVVIAGTIVAALLAISATQWNRYQQERARWLGALVSATADDRLRERWSADPQLQDVLDRISSAHLAELDASDGSAIALSPSEYFRRRDAVAAANAIADDLSSAHWQRLGHLSDLQSQFKSRGWTQPAEFLGTLITGAAPPAANLAAGIDRVLDTSAAIDRTLPPIDAAWNKLTAATDILSAPHNPMLDAFADHLRTSAADSLHLSDTGLTESDHALGSRLQLAAELDTATRDSSVDGGRFSAALASRINVNHVTDADVRTYLNTVAQFSIQKDAIGSATDTLRRALADMSQTIAGSRPRPAEAPALAKDRAAVESQIKDFSDSPFIAGDLSDGTFAHRQQAIAMRIEALGKYSHPQTAAEWIASLPAPPVTSPTLLAAWQGKLQSLSAAAPALDRDRLAFLDIKATSARYRQSLIDLGQAFTRPPATLTPPFAAAAMARREQLLKQSLADIDDKTGRIDLSAAHSISGNFDEWILELARLNGDFPLRQPILTPADRPDLAWAKQSDFWNDPAIQQLVAPDLDRIHRLAAVDTANRPQLIADLESPTAEIALESWRHLGEVTNPAWPTHPGELQAEANAEAHLQSLLSPVHDSIAESGLLELRGQEPMRWQRFAQAARSDQAIQSAIQLAPAFGIARGQFDRLPWPANFDFWLAATRNAARAGDEATLDADLPHLQGFAKTPGKSVPADLASLGQADPHEPFFGQQLGDTYALSLPGLAKPMEFRRVESGELRPFYMTTSAVSLAEFAGAIDGAKAWGDARTLPWSTRPGQPDNRRGPRVWQWTGAGDAAHMVSPDLWFNPDDANDFAPRFRASEFNRNSLADAFGGSPSAGHPMQQISAESALWYAGLCGVRLPSSREWLAAYAAFGKDVPIERWNLRDQTWDDERQYLASVSAAGGVGPRWMDEEIFLPADAHLPTGVDARSRADNDGTLLFRTAGAGDQTFHDLVGNVFVYLCDAADAYNALADKGPASIHQFAAAHADSLAVIGGSALSPPELPIDKPLALPHPDACYADVGLRLAFTAPPRSRAERVRWALEDQPYIWPATPSVNR
jgi:formylglycine-generating enzyme required for sulfatase activity